MGRQIMLARNAPYKVVNSATAIAGPIDLGSSMLESMATRPIRVPIIPIAGAISPMPLKMVAPNSCRSVVIEISFAKVSLTTSMS